jgi:glycerol-1-phosphate dehydrogenase [NAD(P)+]
VAAFYEQIMRQPFDRLDVERCVAQWPSVESVEAETRAMFAGDDFVATAVTEMRAKHVTAEVLRAQLSRLRKVWPETKRRLGAQLLPHAEVVRRLRAVGAPVEPEEIGLTRERLRRSFHRAQRIRRRFTVLDLAVRTCTLEPALDGLFETASSGPQR